MTLRYDTIHNADCIEWLTAQEEPFADLIFADPPFNIGFKYDVYEDRMAYEEYYAWTRAWMKACADALKPTGSFWIAIGDEYAAEVRLLGRELGLNLRNWVIWHYTFGQQTKAKFARSHAHLFYFVKDPANFTFNDKAVRTFSDRQKVYKDRRANKAGKVPDDTWNEFSRLCGTFAEREGWHPCQMPETTLTRIVLACSRAGDVVFDPFSGSGTTAAVARKFSRRYLGTELSAEYAKKIGERLAAVTPLAEFERTRPRWSPHHVALLQMVYQAGGVATDTLAAKPEMLAGMTQHFNWQVAAGGGAGDFTTEEVWCQLETLRRGAQLGRIRVHAVESSTAKVRALRDEKASRRPGRASRKAGKDDNLFDAAAT